MSTKLYKFAVIMQTISLYGCASGTLERGMKNTGDESKNIFFKKETKEIPKTLNKRLLEENQSSELKKLMKQYVTISGTIRALKAKIDDASRLGLNNEKFQKGLDKLIESHGLEKEINSHPGTLAINKLKEQIEDLKEALAQVSREKKEEKEKSLKYKRELDRSEEHNKMLHEKLKHHSEETNFYFKKNYRDAKSKVQESPSSTDAFSDTLIFGENFYSEDDNLLSSDFEEPHTHKNLLYSPENSEISYARSSKILPAMVNEQNEESLEDLYSTVEFMLNQLNTLNESVKNLENQRINPESLPQKNFIAKDPLELYLPNEDEQVENKTELDNVIRHYNSTEDTLYTKIDDSIYRMRTEFTELNQKSSGHYHTPQAKRSISVDTSLSNTQTHYSKRTAPQTPMDNKSFSEANKFYYSTPKASSSKYSYMPTTPVSISFDKQPDACNNQNKNLKDTHTQTYCEMHTQPNQEKSYKLPFNNKNMQKKDAKARNAKINLTLKEINKKKPNNNTRKITDPPKGSINSTTIIGFCNNTDIITHRAN